MYSHFTRLDYVSKRYSYVFLYSILIFFGFVSKVLATSTDPVSLCDDAAQRASSTSIVPLRILRAITRTETGRGDTGALMPWPWTVNMEGKGVWFDTEDQARVYVFRHFKRGARSFDIGCFQINYRWHHQEFKSIDDMFDPHLNAEYAAKFLETLYAELGDWNKAVGAYHSRTHKYAKRYLTRYAEVRDNLPTIPTDRDLKLQEKQQPIRNRGSLMPLGQSPARSLFAKSES